MYETIVKFLLKFENISITWLATLCATLCFLIFISDPVADRLKLLSFRNQYAVFLGPLFLLSIFFLLARVLGGFRKIFLNRRARKSREKRLNQLTSEERGYLFEFIVNGRNTIKVGLDDGIMGGLVAKGICYRSSSMFHLLEGASFNLQPWARTYLEANPEVLNGAVGEPLTPRQEKRRRYGL